MVKFGISSLRKAIFKSQRGLRTRSTNSTRWPLFTAAIRDEQGQVLVWVALGMVLFLSASAFALDLGHAYLVRKQLQSSADAAALAAAWHLTDGTYSTVALTYGSTGTLNNYDQGYTVDTPTITGKCSTTIKGWGIDCNAGSTPPVYNMVTVQEVAHVPTFFAGVMGFKTLTVSATSAASKGARPTPYNIAVVFDLTTSMTFTDPVCGKTQLACGEGALQVLLKDLDPAQDYVGLFIFPAFKDGTQSKETGCSSTGRVTAEKYVFPSTSGSTVDTPTLSNGDKGTYELVPFTNGYLNSYGGSLNTSNALTIAAGKGSCTGMVADNGNDFTYFAASIYQAHEALLAEQATRATAGVTSKNAMIILSDGNASARNTSTWQDSACLTGKSGSSCSSGITSSTGVNPSDTTGTYPSLVGMCGQAVDAASSFNDLTTGDTEVFSVAYGSNNGTDKSMTADPPEGVCQSDISAGKHPNINPCTTMKDMASSSADFFADGNSVTSGCTSSNSSTDLTAIAAAIVSKLTETRLIPPDTP